MTYKGKNVGKKTNNSGNGYVDNMKVNKNHPLWFIKVSQHTESLGIIIFDQVIILVILSS